MYAANTQTQVYGSVIPRCLLHATFGAVLGGLLKGFSSELVEEKETWLHPYSLHVFATVLGFSLVMRIQAPPPLLVPLQPTLFHCASLSIQIAYGRLWEGASQCHQASSKWADAVMQARRGSIEVEDRKRRIWKGWSASAAMRSAGLGRGPWGSLELWGWGWSWGRGGGCAGISLGRAWSALV